MRDTRNTSITHRDLAHDRCEKRSRGIWQRVDTATRYRACRCGTLRAEWQCNSRQPVRSGSSGSALHTATRYRTYRCGTLRVEWQCNRYAQGRVAVHFTLPLDGERTGPVRSGPSGSATGTFGVEWQCGSRQLVRSGSSGSATHGNRYVQGRVAVHFTLPLGIERADAVRSGSSGSATGTLRVEWQCGSHQPVRSGSSGSAGRDGPKLVSATSASGCALSEAGPKPYRERPLREGESLCNWVDATGWPFCRLQLGPLFAGWMVPFLQAGWSPGRSG